MHERPSRPRHQRAARLSRMLSRADFVPVGCATTLNCGELCRKTSPSEHGSACGGDLAWFEGPWLRVFRLGFVLENSQARRVASLTRPRLPLRCLRTSHFLGAPSRRGFRLQDRRTSSPCSSVTGAKSLTDRKMVPAIQTLRKIVVQ
jgi:hypothetical protein